MSDLLEQATRALRETSAEPQPRSGLTRARVLESAEKRYAGRRIGLLRWVVALVAVLAASTALARVAQYWPEIKRVLAPSSEPSGATPAQAKKRAAKPTAAAPVLPLSAASAPAPEVSPQPPLSPTSEAASSADARAPSITPAMPAPRRVMPQSRRPKVVAVAPPAPAVEPEPAPAAAPAPDPTPTPVITLAPKPEPEPAELALFRRAQRLHLNHDPKALAAWDDYLKVARSGALVPEAKYNRALSLIRLGRKAEARSALTPFAIGEYGSYRRTEAKSLIEALERTAN